MPLSPELMRLFLLLCILGMAVLAVFFLRQRRLTLLAYLGWGMLIVLVPLIGPFMVILIQPGEHRILHIAPLPDQRTALPRRRRRPLRRKSPRKKPIPRS